MTEPGRTDDFQDRVLELLKAIEGHDGRGLVGISTLRSVLLDLRDFLLSGAVNSRTAAHPNPLTRYGCQCFSQSDEDGITLETCAGPACAVPESLPSSVSAMVFRTTP
jgi:hypothetical protein